MYILQNMKNIMKRLKTTELKEIRINLLNEQKNICPLCNNEIFEDEDVLDHDHDTGRVRAVLHRSCNQTEGRIKSWIKRSRSDEYIPFLENLINYLKKEHTTYEHPSLMSDRWKKFGRLNKDEQIIILTEEWEQVLTGKEKKKDLLKLYKKLIK